MASLNIANMNTLFKKGYLLAGVMMAANMFVVNEMKATENDVSNEKKEIEQEDISSQMQQNDLDGYNKNALSLQRVLNSVLHYENYINLIGGLVSSGFINNYFKLWNYDAGSYFKLGCRGWRSKRLLNGIFQFDINLNLGRGALWMIATFFGSYRYLEGRISITDLKCTAAVIMNSIMNNSWVRSFVGVNLFFFLSSLQGFVSMPLAIHISNFSISISFDSILHGGIGMYLNKCKQGEQGKKKGDNEIELDDEDNKSEKSQEASEEKDN